jgi:glycosyltransferase involved in cell wall biosynthesis
MAAEHRLGGEAAAVVTVGPELAGLLREHYGWHDVAVVRNTFPMEAVEPGRPSGPPTAAVYAGRIGPGRDLETVVAAAARVTPVRSVLVGPADAGYLAALPTDGVEVLDSLPIGEAAALLRSSGIALVTLSDRWLNNRIGLPNKLFMAVQAGVPVVAADLPGLRRVVGEHDLGALYRPGDAASYAAAVRTVCERYDELTAAVEAARPALSWERDAAVLTAVYADVAAGRRARSGYHPTP